MDSMEDKLGSLLSNPQLMQQIMTMANSLTQSNENQKQPRQEQPSPSAPPIDPKLLSQLSGLAGQGNVGNDQRALLNALCPYLSRDRLQRLEKAMRAAKMAQFASGFLNQGGVSLLSGR